MDTSDLKPRSTKREQWRNIESSVRAMLPLGSISQYHLFHGGEDDFTPDQPVASQFAACVSAVLVERPHVATGPATILHPEPGSR